jgi:hypothetical protein
LKQNKILAKWENSEMGNWQIGEMGNWRNRKWRFGKLAKREMAKWEMAKWEDTIKMPRTMPNSIRNVFKQATFCKEFR